MHAPVQPAASRDPAKDQPLIDDIRLLGSMLGDVIREHDGQSSFALVENVRRLSVSYQRDSDVAGRSFARIAAPRHDTGASRLGHPGLLVFLSSG